MPEFIDTHTHLYDRAFEGCEAEIVERALDAGVRTLIQADVGSSERGLMRSVSEKFPGVVRNMLGLYPGSVRENWKEEIDIMINSQTSDVVAIGEIGLDYHYGKEFEKEQKEALRVQFELAAEWNLPVNIHLRDATEDFIKILEDCSHLHLRGNLHAFSGSYETFSRIARTGDWYVGIGGVVTFKKATIASQLKRISLERIVLETDAPYLTPVPYRGKRNESSMIPIIAQAVADFMEESLERVAEVTTKNAKSLFAL